MVAKKKGSRKKRQISKHVLKARADGGKKKIDGQNSVNEERTAEATLTTSNNSSVVAEKNNSGNKHMKDPSEASEYLLNWDKNRKNEPSNNWKFNKNTQSWLIRHCYDVNKVPKATFKVLLEYLHGLKGESMRVRIKEDASRRARRYKQHIKNDTSSSSDGRKDHDDDDDENKSSDEKIQTNNDGGKTNNKTSPIAGDQFEDETRWNKLSDNEKRKEYKRARLILDAFKD